MMSRSTLLLLSFLAATASAQQQVHHRSLFLDWLFGNRNDDDDTNDRGVFGDFLCSLFNSCEDDGGSSSSNPVGDLIDDILNTSDGSTPVRDAIDATRNSETPLKDFLRELLDQPNSDTPVRDFIGEALNRTDAPFLDFIAELFNTTDGGTPIVDFVTDLLNGTESPLESALSNWFGSEIFEEKNCTNVGAPACAYNIDGELGVWICRTWYNPFNGKEESVTDCAVPQFTLKDNDVCGSCDNTYPAPCPCSCDADGKPGVYVTLSGQTGRQCVNEDWATGARNRFEQVTCVAAVDCPAV